MNLVGFEAEKFAEKNNLLSYKEAVNLSRTERKEKSNYYWWIAMTTHLVDRIPWLAWWGDYYPAYKRRKKRTLSYVKFSEPKSS